MPVLPRDGPGPGWALQLPAGDQTGSSASDPEENLSMARALRRYEAGEIDEEQVETETPDVAKAFIRSTLQKADKKYWISLLLIVLIFLAQWRMSDDSTRAVEQSVGRAQTSIAEEYRRLDQQEQLVCEEVSEMMKQPEPSRDEAVGVTRRSPTPRAEPSPTSIAPPAVLPNRNDPCWCGSGRKFKRCHLAETGEQTEP